MALRRSLVLPARCGKRLAVQQVCLMARALCENRVLSMGPLSCLGTRVRWPMGRRGLTFTVCLHDLSSFFVENGLAFSNLSGFFFPTHAMRFMLVEVLVCFFSPLKTPSFISCNLCVLPRGGRFRELFTLVCMKPPVRPRGYAMYLCLCAPQSICVDTIMIRAQLILTQDASDSIRPTRAPKQVRFECHCAEIRLGFSRAGERHLMLYEMIDRGVSCQM